MKRAATLIRRSAKLGAIVPFAALLCGTAPASATALLGSDLASFAVLGGSAVTNTGATTISGNLGVSPLASITGLGSITLSGALHQNDTFAASAQSELGTAITNLGSLGPGTLELVNLGGLTLTPGVYSFASTAQLTGTLTLDGGGNANAAWVFLIPSSLTTAAGAAVDVIDTGAGAGVYWDVGSSATLGATTSFEGNILANTAITLGNSATIGCGRALAQSAAVTMDTNTIDATDCSGTDGTGSNGFSGGLDVTGTDVSFLPFAPISGTTTVPEPGILLPFGFGLIGLFALRRKFLAVG
jgi:hypothetical protein